MSLHPRSVEYDMPAVAPLHSKHHTLLDKPGMQTHVILTHQSFGKDYTPWSETDSYQVLKSNMLQPALVHVLLHHTL